MNQAACLWTDSILFDMFHRIRWPHSWGIIQNEETGDINVSEWSCGWSS